MNLKPEIRNQKLLIIGHHWPEPKTTAAGHRMLQLIRAFSEWDLDIFFGSAATKTDFSTDLSSLNISEVTIKLNDASFDALVRDLKPDFVMFDRFMVEEQFGWRVAENVPQATRILNTEDLHSLRNYREVAVRKGVDFDHNDWMSTDKAKREMASIFRSDIILMVSDFETALLTDTIGVPKSHVLHVPFMLPKLGAVKKGQWPDFDNRIGMVCFGNGKHAPNVDSIKRLKTILWPQIRKRLPEAQLKIFGAYLPESIKQLNNEKEGFLIEGWTENLEKELRRARLHLAPLRFGAGIKGKLIDAMQSGLPSITTLMGAEGMHKNLPWAGHIAKDDSDFVEATVQLYQNKKAWYKAQQNGITIINTIYGTENLKTRLFDALREISENLAAHRNENFVGSLLQHQSMAATKFMGKWIEEKNKR